MAVVIVLPSVSTRCELLRTDEAVLLDLLRRQWPGKERVLPAEEGNVVEAEFVTIRIEGDRLSDVGAGTGRVFDAEIAECHSVGIDEHRVASEGAELSDVRGGHKTIETVRDDRFRRTFPEKCQARCGDGDTLVVDAL